MGVIVFLHFQPLSKLILGRKNIPRIKIKIYNERHKKTVKDIIVDSLIRQYERSPSSY
jgi:hypothetical protein